jgi:transposase
MKNAQRELGLDCETKPLIPMSILSKDTIKNHIVPLLPMAKRGRKLTEADQISVVGAIFYRLKTGCQWEQLPVKSFFDKPYSYKTVFYHFNQWSKQGIWQKVWVSLLSAHKKHLDMSTIQLDGTQTRCYKARQSSGYQSRKADQSTNLLFLSDNQGVLLALSDPVSGQHHEWLPHGLV